MNLDHLNYFLTAAQTLHTNKAAKILNVSQSTISHGIKRLEEELGVDLFENLGKRIVLTETGKRLAIKGRYLWNQAQLLTEEMRDPSIPLEGSYRIGASHGISNRIISSSLAKMQRKFPRVSFELLSLRSSQVVQGIVEKTLDLGFCFSPTPHPEVREIFRQDTDLVIAVRKGHPMLLKATHAKGVSSYVCASPKAAAGIEVCENHPALVAIGIQSNVSLIFDSYEVAGAYLKSSNAWCLMPSAFLKLLGLERVPIKDLNAKACISLLSPKGRPIPSTLETELKNVFTSIPK